MMEVAIRKSSLFRSDLMAIVDYIAIDNGPSAYRFVGAVEDTIELLRQMPEIGTKFPRNDARFENLRRITIRGYGNYVLIYDVRSDEVLILRIVHGARDLPL